MMLVLWVGRGSATAGHPVRLPPTPACGNETALATAAACLPQLPAEVTVVRAAWTVGSE